MAHMNKHWPVYSQHLVLLDEEGGLSVGSAVSHIDDARSRGVVLERLDLSGRGSWRVLWAVEPVWQLRIDSGGGLGIGTRAPTARIVA